MVEFQTEEATQVSGQWSVKQTALLGVSATSGTEGAYGGSSATTNHTTDMAMSVSPTTAVITESKTGWIANSYVAYDESGSIRLTPPPQSQMFASKEVGLTNWLEG